MKGHVGALVEAALGTVIITIIGMVLPEQWGLLGLHPHPLWIVVLAIAVRYGSPMAYVAAILAAGSYVFSLMLQQGGLQLPEAHALIEPFLFLVVGGAVGEIARGPIRSSEEAISARQRDAAARSEIEERLQTALAVKGELEKRIVSQPSSVSTMYELAKQLDVQESVALYPASLDLIAEYLGAESCALYRSDGRALQLIEGRPLVSTERPLTLSLDAGLVARALAEGRVVTAWEPTQTANTIPNRALLAGPLRGESDAILGIIVIEEMPFLRLTPTTLRLFELLLDWSSTALTNALRYERARAGNVRESTSGLYLPMHTSRLLNEEFHRARRYELPLSIVVLRLETAANTPMVVEDSLWAALGRLARGQLRTADTLGRHDDSAAVVLILPMTDMQGASVIGHRLAQTWLTEGIFTEIRPQVQMGIAWYRPGLESAAELMSHAMTTLQPFATPRRRDDELRLAEDAAD